MERGAATKHESTASLAGRIVLVTGAARGIGARGRSGLDVPVNYAGRLATGSVDKTSGEAWDRLVAVNLSGVVNCDAGSGTAHARAHRRVQRQHRVGSAEKGGSAIGNVW